MNGLLQTLATWKPCLWEFLRYALRLHLLFSLFGDKSNTSMDMSGSGRIPPLPNVLVYLLSYNLLAAAGTERWLTWEKQESGAGTSRLEIAIHVLVSHRPANQSTTTESKNMFCYLASVEGSLKQRVNSTKSRSLPVPNTAWPRSRRRWLWHKKNICRLCTCLCQLSKGSPSCFRRTALNLWDSNTNWADTWNINVYFTPYHTITIAASKIAQYVYHAAKKQFSFTSRGYINISQYLTAYSAFGVCQSTVFIGKMAASHGSFVPNLLRFWQALPDWCCFCWEIENKEGAHRATLHQ